jgi:MFS family permease
MRVLPVTFTALSSRTGLRRVLVAYALYDLVEFSIWLAIILYAFDRSGAELAGTVAVVQLLPASLIAPMLVSIGDRMPRGTALLMAHAGVAVATLLTSVAIVAQAPLWVVVLASTAATTSVAVVRPIHFAALPLLATSTDDLVSANCLSSAADGAGLFLGPVLAGIGAAYVGPWLVFSVASGFALVATLLCLGLRIAGSGGPAEGEPDDWRAAAQGLRALRRDRPSLALLALLTSGFVMAGALDVLGVAYSVDVLGRGQSGAGLIVGALGLGAFVGASWAARFSGRRRLTPVIAAAGLAQGLCFALVAALRGLSAAMLVIALVGAASALLLVASRTLMQRAVDDRILARVFAVQEGASLLGLAFGAASVTVLLRWLSPAGAFVPLGIGAALLALFVIPLVRRLDDRAAYLPHELSLLRGVDFLEVLPAYELERLAQLAAWRELAGGAEAVRQGDTGEDFFVIGEGSFTVSVDGSPVGRTLTAGEAFGEIALLEAIPRTATVTANSPARLLVVSGADFLAAVTGSVDGTALAAEVARAHQDRDARGRRLRS